MIKNEPRVGVGAMILQEGEVLLVLRKKSPEKDHWSLPGGKVELYETLEDAVKREIKEELNLEIQLDQLLCATNHILIEEDVHYVAPTYLAHITDGNPCLMEPDALGGMGWFPLDELPQNLTVTTVNALDAYLKFTKK